MENRLPIGEFVRTKGGRIGKIMSYTIQYEIKYVDNMIVDEPHEAYRMDTNYSFDDEKDIWTDDMIKSHGKSLGDVIEHGDLVNMLLVLRVYEPVDREKSCFIIEVIDGNHTVELIEDDIRHVVCREILEQDGYKRKEEE